MKRTLIGLGIVIILAGGVFFSLPHSNKHLQISAILTTEQGGSIKVRIAKTARERELGLSYFKSLPQDEGMLFVFDKPGTYPFWMKGMNFPLDIIWLKRAGDNQFQVVHTVENLSPSTYPSSFVSQGLADAVLEVNSGVSAVHNLTPEKNLWISFKK